MSLRRKPRAPLEHLSTREKQMLQCLWDGLQYKEIAMAMGLSDRTVKNYLHSVYTKLDTKTGIQAVRRGLELGILSCSQQYMEDWP